MNTGHLISVLIGLIGVICCEFLIYNGNKSKDIDSNNFMLDPSLTQD